MIQVHDTTWNGSAAKYVTLLLRNESNDDVFVSKGFVVNEINEPLPLVFTHSFPFKLPLSNQDYSSTHNPLNASYDIPYSEEVITPNLSNHKFSKSFTLRNYTINSDEMEFRVLFAPTSIGGFSGYLSLDYSVSGSDYSDVITFTGSLNNGIIEMDVTNYGNIFKVDSKLFFGVKSIR